MAEPSSSENVEQETLSEEGEQETLSENVELLVPSEEIEQGTPGVAMAQAKAAIFEPPRKSVSPLFIVTLSVSLMAGGLSVICIKQLLLPLQVSLIDPIHTNSSFTLVASLSAFIGMIASPLLGAVSDRTPWRWGRRRPWIVFGLIALVIGLLLMAFANSVAGLLIGEIVIQIGNDTLFATLNALIPDLVPPQQRTLATATGGMAPTFGGVLGLLLVNGLTNTRIPAQGYVLLAIVSVILVLGVLFVVREQPLPVGALPSFRLGTFLFGLIRPLGRRDFALVFVSRFLAFLGFTILGAYLLFSLRAGNQIPIPVAAGRVTTFQVTSAIALLIASLLIGLTKRNQFLKPLVVGGALLMTVGLLILVLMPLWPQMLLAACFFGGGFGIYLAADLNLAIRVLPRQEESGKDLGILNMTIFLTLIVSPIVGGVVVATTHSYTILFGLAALACLGAAGLILLVKSVR